MIRPFLVIEEFTQYTGFNIEKSIVMRPKKIGKDVELIIGIITGFKIQEKQVAIGASWYSLQELFENYEYEKGDKWCVFGTVEPDEVKEKKTAKFKVGHKYKDADEGTIFTVNAKYTSPVDKELYLVVERIEGVLDVQVIAFVAKDENGDEYIYRLADDYSKVECSARDEVKE